MICTRIINDSATPPKKKPVKDNSTPTSWEVNVGNRLSELGKAIATRGEIKDEWHRELYNICDFITYMEMGENI